MSVEENRGQGSGPGRLRAVDALRGIASLAVCWYHLVFANHAFGGADAVSTLLRNSARNAWTGVEVFFVISGFVVPLALFRSRYRVRSYGTFLLKRIIRLDPPYLVSIILSLVLAYLSAHVRRLHGAPFHVSIGAVLLHLGYLNAFAGKGWLNPVYWTLAIEFQYYLGMGLLFAALASRLWAVRASIFVLLAALAFLVPAPSLVFHYLFVFMVGLATFQFFVGLWPLPLYLALLGIAALGCYLTLGPMVAAVALGTALIIVSVKRSTRLLAFLGSISYSLYLVHVPVGGRVMDLLLPHAPGVAGKCLVLALALSVTVATAYVLYVLVERPALRWASRIRYRGTGDRLSAPESSGVVATGIAEP